MPAVGRWSLRRRLLIAVSAMSVVLVTLLAVSMTLLVSVRSQQHQVITRYFQAVSLSNHRFTQQVDAETAVRGFALTDDPSTLNPLRQLNSTNYAMSESRLRLLLSGDVPTLTALSSWDDAAVAWYRQWAVPTIAQVRRGGSPNITAHEVLVGKSLFDVNRSLFDKYSKQLVGKRDNASHSLSLRSELLEIAVVIFAVVLLLVSAGSWIGLRRWVLQPLRELGEEARLVSGGELGHAMGVKGPMEIQDLAGDVEAMRREIVDQLAEVERATADLARSNRDLEQFAYVASHDLQEPLRKVASFCQLLEQRYAGQLDERADQYIAFAVDGAKRMQQLINDLLAFSRVGRSDREATVVDLQGCFEDAVDNLSVVIDEVAAEVTADPLPTVHGDAALLTQLLQNLIGNGIKFRGDEPPRVSITVRQVDQMWEFACADNGLGIEPQYADRIFVIFQRLHPKDEYAGTGIGLALCKRIVEHHGGRIWLDTAATRGAMFRWTLPVAAPGPADDVPSEAESTLAELP